MDKGYMGDFCYRQWDPEHPIALLKSYCRQYLYVWATGGKVRIIMPLIVETLYLKIM